MLDRRRCGCRQEHHTAMICVVALLGQVLSFTRTTTAFVMPGCEAMAKASVAAGQRRAPAATGTPARLLADRGRLGVDLGCASAATGEPVSGTARCVCQLNGMVGCHRFMRSWALLQLTTAAGDSYDLTSKTCSHSLLCTQEPAASTQQYCCTERKWSEW